MRKITGLFLLLLTSIPSIGIAREKKSQKNEISNKAVEERKRKITRDIIDVLIEKVFFDICEQMKRRGFEKEIPMFLEELEVVFSEKYSEEQLQQYLIELKDENYINTESPEIIKGMKDFFKKGTENMGALRLSKELLQSVTGSYASIAESFKKFSNSINKVVNQIVLAVYLASACVFINFVVFRNN